MLQGTSMYSRQIQITLSCVYPCRAFHRERVGRIMGIDGVRKSQIAVMKVDLSSNAYMIKKGAKTQFLRDNANLKMLAEKLAEDILDMNLSFKDEIKSLEDDSEELARD